MSAKDEYMKLLEEETTHRSHWDDFRRKFKRDPRFKNFSDDKEKEKTFRNHVKGLKEKESERENLLCNLYNIIFYIYIRCLIICSFNQLGKRVQQKKAEEDFVRLLREMREIKYNSSWRKV